MAETVRYSEALTIRCQPEIAQLVQQAALRKGSKPAEYLRQALLTALRLDGMDPAAVARSSRRSAATTSCGSSDG